jgi:hypothetical protein
MGTGGSSGAKKLGFGTNHLPPFSAKVKNIWSYTSTSPYIFKAENHNFLLHLDDLYESQSKHKAEYSPSPSAEVKISGVTAVLTKTYSWYGV